MSIRMASGPDGAGDAIVFLGCITLLGEVDTRPDVAPKRDDGYNSAGRRPGWSVQSLRFPGAHRGVAQLVARHVRDVEVPGSSPGTPTIFPH